MQRNIKLKKQNTTNEKSKFLTAQEAARIYGVNAKTLLNRSGLSKCDSRYIPSFTLQGGGRRKYFERKVMDRLFVIEDNASNSGRTS